MSSKSSCKQARGGASAPSHRTLGGNSDVEGFTPPAENMAVGGGFPVHMQTGAPCKANELGEIAGDGWWCWPTQ